MIFLVSVVYLFLVMVFIVTLFNFLTAPLLSRYPDLIDTPSVSVLVPVRNEEETLRKCLQGLIHQNYPDYEIIVLDDGSTDRSRDIVLEMQEIAPVKLIVGKPLPPGWTGKNWACHQLSQSANGDILVFTDADNIHKPDALRATVNWMRNYDLGLLSAFPQQLAFSTAEKLVLPVVDMWVYSMLPLWLTRYSKHPSLAAANGQWLAFTRDAYNKTGGHDAVKKEIVEDTVLSRLAKQKGIHILTLAGRDIVFGKMYNGWKQVLNGFSKNLFGIMGYHTFGFLFFLFLMFVAFVLPYFMIWTDQVVWTTALMINLLIRLMLVIKYKHSFIESVILHPISIILFIMIGFNSIIRYYSGNVEWKGRNVIFEK